ncbi:PAS domain-containing protein [Hymenobacter sp.]|uniref:PAS domain-containing protein n=1 Tax=Hymenobacter sp. TaxID=1898978 RepID=UPI002ED8F6DF
MAVTPVSGPEQLLPNDVLQVLFDVSLTGVILFRPVYAPAGQVVDLAYVRLNPAAQRMLQLPGQPSATFLTLYPAAVEEGIFAFYRDSFLSGQPGRYDVNYQHDGLDNFFQLAAERAGELLVVSFSDTSDHDRTAAEQALRASQARERAARDQAERQQQQLSDVLHQAPVAIAYLEGPTYRITLANPAVCEIWARTQQQVVGLPLLEAMPELVGQGIDDLLDGVLRSGQPYTGTELPVELQRHGRRETIYFNFVYQPQFDAESTTTGVLVVANDVTALVVARQQIEEQERQTNLINEEMATSNEELQAANEEVRASNDELISTQLDLQSLNQELEARVADRTQQLQLAQIQTEQQRRRLEALFMQAPAAICILAGPNLVYELVNPGYQQLFPDRELLGLPILQALPEITDHAVYRTFQQVYQTGQTHQEQALLIPLARSVDGVVVDRYFNYIQQPRYDEQGRIDGVLVFAFEVTDQVLARQASAASAQRLQLLTDALPVLIGYLDQEQKYRFANHAYGTWFNQDPAALLGQSARDVVGELAYQQAQEYIERALAGERVDFEARMHYRENFTKYIATSYVPDVQNGQILGFYSLVTDITEQVLAREQVQTLNEDLAALNEELQVSNEELRDSNAQLTRTNADLDNFIYTASHDLRAPITNIEGLLNALRQELPPAPNSEQSVEPILHHMRDSVERFKRTIEHLTDVSKLQKEYVQPFTQVNLADIIADVQLDLTPLLKQTAAEVTVAVQTCPPIAFSEKNLRSVVYNLLSNALKYRHPERPAQVHLRARPEGDYLLLEVQDNGLGIDLRQREKLFAMFQRYHTHVEGSGIGLYMVKKIMENAGGKIEVASQLNIGSTFSVYFPR